MSSPARRKELREQWEQECARREIEEGRKANLTMWERIDEAESVGELKEILHLIAQHVGLEG